MRKSLRRIDVVIPLNHTLSQAWTNKILALLIVVTATICQTWRAFAGFLYSSCQFLKDLSSFSKALLPSKSFLSCMLCDSVPRFSPHSSVVSHFKLTTRISSATELRGSMGTLGEYWFEIRLCNLICVWFLVAFSWKLFETLNVVEPVGLWTLCCYVEFAKGWSGESFLYVFSVSCWLQSIKPVAHISSRVLEHLLSRDLTILVTIG